MLDPLASASARRVRAALDRAGLGDAEVRAFGESTRTAAGAAAAIGTSVAQIVKSLVFMAGQEPVLVLASGTNRVDTARLAALLGTGVRQATAEEVRAATGFAIGGVAPLGHTRPLRVVVDRDLLAFDEVWAAAGTPNAVFRAAPGALVTAAGGEVADVARSTAGPPTAGASSASPNRP